MSHVIFIMHYFPSWNLEISNPHRYSTQFARGSLMNFCENGDTCLCVFFLLFFFFCEVFVNIIFLQQYVTCKHPVCHPLKLIGQTCNLLDGIQDNTRFVGLSLTKNDCQNNFTINYIMSNLLKNEFLPSHL